MFEPDECSEEALIEMIKFEKDLRYSDHYQSLYHRKNVLDDNNLETFDTVEDIIQMNVLSHFGYDVTEANLDGLRYLYGKHKTNPKVNQYGFWLHMNIMQEGYPEGQVYRDVLLFEPDDGSRSVSFASFIEKALKRNVPLVVLGGSIT